MSRSASSRATNKPSEPPSGTSGESESSTTSTTISSRVRQIYPRPNGAAVRVHRAQFRRRRQLCIDRVGIGTGVFPDPERWRWAVERDRHCCATPSDDRNWARASRPRITSRRLRSGSPRSCRLLAGRSERIRASGQGKRAHRSPGAVSLRGPDTDVVRQRPPHSYCRHSP